MVSTSPVMSQAKQLAGWGHSHTHQQTGCWRTTWAPSYPRAWLSAAEGPGRSPTHQQASTSPSTQPHLQGGEHQHQDLLFPSPTHLWADTNPRSPGHYSQRPRDTAPSTSELVLPLESGFTNQGWHQAQDILRLPTTRLTLDSGPMGTTERDPSTWLCPLVSGHRYRD